MKKTLLTLFILAATVARADPIPAGTVVAWGLDASGQCAVPSSALSDVVAIAAGKSHSLALKSSGMVVAWGGKNYGQCAVPSSALSGVIAISAGSEFSLALKNNGTVVAWGLDASGQCAVPPGLSGVVAISAGEYHSLALKSDGTVVAWGSLGESTVPGVSAISAGNHHSLLLKNDGTVMALGYFLQVPSDLSGVTAISAGTLHNLALKNNGTVVTWGMSGQSEILSDLSDVTAISAGWSHNLAIVVPSRKTTTPRRVPFSWLDEKFPDLTNGFTKNDYENLAWKQYGNYFVWQSYVVGFENPTDETNCFFASIIIEDGKPVITPNPDNRGDGIRKYTLFGNETLNPQSWEKVLNPENIPDNLRFFKVEVDVP